MAVHKRHYLRARAIDLAVDIALDEALALVAGGRLAVRPPLDEVRGSDERRGARARHDEDRSLRAREDRSLRASCECPTPARRCGTFARCAKRTIFSCAKRTIFIMSRSRAPALVTAADLIEWGPDSESAAGDKR